MIRAAVIGLGWWGKHVIRRTAVSENIKPVLAIDPDPAAASFAAAQSLRHAATLAAALDDSDIDAVILCTPHSQHTEQVIAAAKAGKHVFCEKPLALTRLDAERSVAACRAAGVMLGIGHERRYEPAIKEVRRLVHSGALGTIMHAEANFSHDKLANVPAGDWRTSPRDAPAAGMTAMGIHLTDLLIDLLGPVSEVYATTNSRVAYQNNGDVISAHLRFAAGPTAYINAILVTPNYIRLAVFGSKAWVEVRNHTHPDTPGPVDLVLQRAQGPRETHTYDWVDTVRENLELFARAINHHAEYGFSDAQKIGNIAVLEAICRSVAENRPMAVAVG